MERALRRYAQLERRVDAAKNTLNDWSQEYIKTHKRHISKAIKRLAKELTEIFEYATEHNVRGTKTQQVYIRTVLLRMHQVVSHACRAS
jgi:dsDNA-specific endonuclease/ATPase MutS2